MATKSKLSTTNYVLLVGLVCLVVVIVTLVVGRTLVASMLLNQKVINHKQAASKQLDTNLSNATELKSNYQALGSQQTVIANALPTSEDFGGLANIIGSVAGTSGVKFKGVTATQAPDGGASTAGDAKPFNFTIDVEGSFASISTFIQSLELSARPVQIIGLGYTSSGNVVDANLTAQSFSIAPVTITNKTEVIK